MQLQSQIYRGAVPIMEQAANTTYTLPKWVRGSLIGPSNSSLMDALFPTAGIVRKALISLLMICVLVALGRATFYLPDNPVPITFQTTGVLLMGGVLGLRWGLLAILVYYFLGMAGIPVFKDGGNGWHYVSSTVTAGYIFGFIAAVPLIGYLSQRGWHRSRILWPMLLGNMMIYVPALLWLQIFDFGWPAEGELFKSGMYTFLPGDLVKLVIASLVVGLGWNISDRLKGRNRQ